jgi:hypothetical protein
MIKPCGEFVGRAEKAEVRKVVGSVWREGVQGTLRSHRGQEVYNVKVVDVNIPARISKHYSPYDKPGMPTPM